MYLEAPVWDGTGLREQAKEKGCSADSLRLDRKTWSQEDRPGHVTYSVLSSLLCSKIRSVIFALPACGFTERYSVSVLGSWHMASKTPGIF